MIVTDNFIIFSLIGMDILSFILNITIRVRHRRMYAGGCVLLLLLVTVILLFVMGPDHYPLWSLGLSSNDYTVSLVDRQQDDSKSHTCS